MYKIWSRQDNLESNITPRNLPEDRYWSGALYKKSGGLGTVREREKRMGKDLEVEKRKPWLVAQEVTDVIAD